ncbi:hypothetical protein M0811_06075 [Anaeramoeba ignava]|uniref:Transmembrane protein n=1 Tax=Anaeramoeba ignava TaxID=1746090 RepID=A0A9Q0LPV9_ANAIG|nr:hypothetical protein M0811_06075 [Anaeramoeba ignava]
MVGKICCRIFFWISFWAFFVPPMIWLIIDVVTRSKFESATCEIVDKHYTQYKYDFYDDIPDINPQTTPQYRSPNPFALNSDSNSDFNSDLSYFLSLKNLFGASCYPTPTYNYISFFLLNYTTKDGKEYSEYACNFGRRCWTATGALNCRGQHCSDKISSKDCKIFVNLKTDKVYEKYDIGTADCWYSKAKNEYATIHFPIPSYLWSLFFWVPCFFFCLPVLSYYFKKKTKDENQVRNVHQANHQQNRFENHFHEPKETNETIVIDEPPPKATRNDDFGGMNQLYQNFMQNQNQNQNQFGNNDIYNEPKGNDEIPMEVIQMQMDEYQLAFDNQQEQQNQPPINQFNAGPLYNPYNQDANQPNRDF